MVAFFVHVGASEQVGTYVKLGRIYCSALFDLLFCEIVVTSAQICVRQFSILQSMSRWMIAEKAHRQGERPAALAACLRHANRSATAHSLPAVPGCLRLPLAKRSSRKRSTETLRMRILCRLVRLDLPTWDAPSSAEILAIPTSKGTAF